MDSGTTGAAATPLAAGTGWRQTARQGRRQPPGRTGHRRRNRPPAESGRARSSPHRRPAAGRRRHRRAGAQPLAGTSDSRGIAAAGRAQRPARRRQRVRLRRSAATGMAAGGGGGTGRRGPGTNDAGLRSIRPERRGSASLARGGTILDGMAGKVSGLPAVMARARFHALFSRLADRRGSPATTAGFP